MAADLFRVIWSDVSPAGQLPSAALARPAAEEMFAALATLPACAPDGGARVRLVREQDFRPAPLIELDRHILGCARWVRRGGACALPSGHDGECVRIEGAR